MCRVFSESTIRDCDYGGLWDGCGSILPAPSGVGPVDDEPEKVRWLRQVPSGQK
jgi:hypothetical protein